MSLFEDGCLGCPHVVKASAVSVETTACKIERMMRIACLENGVDDGFANRKTKKAFNKTKKNEGGGHGLLSLGLQPIEQDYMLDPVSTGVAAIFGGGLRRYVHKRTRMPRAVLTIRKDQVPKDVTEADLDKQLQLLCKIDHPNIVPFRECCEDSKHFRLVYEWCDGGPLMHQMWRYEGMLSESHIAQIIREMLSALVAANIFGVHHCDLGLFSLFLMYAEQLSPVKIFGFGLAGYLMPQVSMRKASRTNKHYYCSPECFTGLLRTMAPASRHASDIWSVGTILYTFCCGRPPFGVGSRKEVSDKVQHGKWAFGLEFDEYTPMLRELLEMMLKPQWRRRATASQALTHPWVEHSSTLQLKNGRVSPVAMQQLQAYAHADHVKQTVARMLTDIGLTTDAYKVLEEKFREMDLNCDGTITLGELVSVSSSLGISESDMSSIVGKLDRNGNCNVDITEFISALVMEQDNADEALIKKAFSKMDRNGDARITKKELFNVLRQYSGTVECNEISQFVGKADDDGDQKMDYREFMGLFHQVRNRYEEIDQRLSEAFKLIKSGPAWLGRFQETLQPWINKLLHYRDKVQYACGFKQMPEHLAAGANYSYEKGHINEFDVQVIIRDLAKLLRDVPGEDFGKKVAKVDGKKARKAALAQHRAAKLAREEEASKPTMIGMAMLTRAQEKVPTSSPVRKRRASIDNGSSGSDNEDKYRTLTDESAVKHWSGLMTKDLKIKRKDPAYCFESDLFTALRWLIRVRSEYHWQLPLFEVLKELREVCVEDVVELQIKFKPELIKLQGCLDDSYICREDTRFDETSTTLKQTSRMLPMGPMEHKNLKSKTHLEKLLELELPTKFYFGYPKEDVTYQRIEHMQAVHMEKLRAVGDFVTSILKELDDLFDGVKEDLAMSNSIEKGLPGPPPMSHLYLKHCMGRELAEDAHTPRADEASISDEEAELEGTSVDMTGTIDNTLTSSKGGSKSMGATGTIVGSHIGQKFKRIERNQVLTETHLRAREDGAKRGK